MSSKKHEEFIVWSKRLRPEFRQCFDDVISSRIHQTRDVEAKSRFKLLANALGIVHRILQLRPRLVFIRSNH